MKLASHVRTFIAAVWMILFAALLSPALAQQQEKSVATLSKEAEVIAVGRVTALKSEWEDGKKRIVTRVTVVVDEYLKKGTESSQTVTIKTLGGEVGEVGELYTHVPTFRQSENVIVFLKKDSRGDYRVSGGTQGKYSLERDAKTGKVMVSGNVAREDFTKAIKQSLEQ